MQAPDVKNWKTFYPLYINSNFTTAKGRKTNLMNSVADPTLEEISQILSHLKIKHVIEVNKRHPSDFFNYGRVRYQLEDENGELFNTEIRNRKMLCNQLGSLIGKLKHRNQPVMTQKQKQKKNKKKRN